MDEDEHDRMSKGSKAIYRFSGAKFKTCAENGYFYRIAFHRFETVGAQVNLILRFVVDYQWAAVEPHLVLILWLQGQSVIIIWDIMRVVVHQPNPASRIYLSSSCIDGYSATHRTPHLRLGRIIHDTASRVWRRPTLSSPRSDLSGPRLR